MKLDQNHNLKLIRTQINIVNVKEPISCFELVWNISGIPFSYRIHVTSCLGYIPPSIVPGFPLNVNVSQGSRLLAVLVVWYPSGNVVESWKENGGYSPQS